MDLARCFFGVPMCSGSFNRFRPRHVFVDDDVVVVLLPLLLPFRPYTAILIILESRRRPLRIPRPHLSPLPLLCPGPLLCRANRLPRMPHCLPIVTLLRLAPNLAPSFPKARFGVDRYVRELGLYVMPDGREWGVGWVRAGVG